MKALILFLALTASFSAQAENITLVCGNDFFQDTEFTLEISENLQEGLIRFRGDRNKYAMQLSAQTAVQDDRGNASWSIYTIEGLKTSSGVALPEVLLKKQSKLGMVKNVFASAEKALYVEVQKGEFVSSDDFGEISCVRTK